MADLKTLTVAEYGELVEALRNAIAALQSCMLIIKDDEARKLGLQLIGYYRAVLNKHSPKG